MAVLPDATPQARISAMAGQDDRPRVEVANRAELRAWLTDHAATSEAVWLVSSKKAAGDRYLPYDDLVDELLCFGWVDSLPRALDDLRSMHLIAPRKPGSGWSRVNKEKVARLIEAGLMTPLGLAAVDRAKANGAWERLDTIETLAIPDDLAASLAAHPSAAAHFAAFPRSSQRLILEWIASARRAETRAARIDETARLAADNIRANHYRQPKGRD